MKLLTVENGLIMDERIDGIPIERGIVHTATEHHCVRTLLAACVIGFGRWTLMHGDFSFRRRPAGNSRRSHLWQPGGAIPTNVQWYKG